MCVGRAYILSSLCFDRRHQKGRSLYNGTFRLTIIAGGPTLDSMRNYSTGSSHSFLCGRDNLNAAHSQTYTPVFSFFDESQELFPTRSGLVWICYHGSPCAKVYPNFPRTPEYFFTLRFESLKSLQTYCSFTTSFTIRLHGIPMDIGTTFLDWYLEHISSG